MTNYSKTTNFTAKDSLVSGDANKIVKGAEIDAEFDNIATASATKANIASPAFTGVVSFPDGTAGDPSITNTGDTNTGLFFSAADTLAFSAAGTAQFTMSNGAIAPVTDNDVDLGTSSLEFKDGYFDGTVHTDAINLNGTAITSTAAEINILDGVTATAAELNILDGVTSTAAELNILDGVTSTAAELNILDGVTATTAELNYNDTGSAVGTVVASKVVTVDANKDVASFRNITLTGELDAGSLDISGDADIDGTLETDALSINGTTVTSTAAELNILDGVTSTAAELNILDGKAFLDEDNMASNSATGIASQQSIKAYVDSQVTAQDLDVTDGSASIDIDLDSESLGILGGTGIDSAASGTGVTLSIDSTVATLTGSQTLTNKTLTAPTLTGTAVVASLDISGDVDVDGTLETDALSINGTAVTSTAAELNILDGVTSTAAELNILDGVTATTAELNYVDGVTSAIQTQIDAKAPIANPTFTGSFTSPGIDDNADAIAITIDSSENVSVGHTTAGGAKFAISDSGNATIQFFPEISTDTNLTQHYDLTATAYMNAETRAASHSFKIGTSDAVAINSSGSVGIGVAPTFTPGGSRKLLQVTNAANGGQISMGNNSSESENPRIFSDADNLGFATATTGGGVFQFYTGGSERMRIDSSGNLLVSTTDSGQTSGVGLKLKGASATAPSFDAVFNTASATASNFHHYNTNATYNGYRFYIQNNGGVANFSANNVNLSDERVKTNIENSGDYLAKICAIPVRLFNYNDEPEGTERNLGVIAQEVEAQAPELVSNQGFGETPEDGVPLKSVYTTDMTYALMKCIQEQQTLIESLTGRIAALEQ